MTGQVGATTLLHSCPVSITPVLTGSSSLGAAHASRTHQLAFDGSLIFEYLDELLWVHDVDALECVELLEV